MHNSILIRYGELALKGKNRIDFERKLVRNIKDCLKKNNNEFKAVHRKRGRLIIETDEKCDKLKCVFGIASFSYAKKENFDIKKIKETTTILLKDLDFETFRVSTNRSDKSIDCSSMGMNIELGQFVVDNFNKKVSLKEFDIDIGVEILDGNSYTFIDRLAGPKGLPYGINGTAFALLTDEKSNLAAYLMMKRGLKILTISKEDFDLSLLNKYNYGYKDLYLQKIKDFDEISELSERMDIFSMISSQSIHEIDDVGLDMLILRPLVGFSDEEMQQKMKSL